jgi:intein/homing endonuclease
MILMGDGTEKAIELIAPGETVMTPAGPRKVLDAGSTGFSHTYTVAGLEGTAGHPVFTNRGWIGLHCLKPGDKILTLSTRTGDVWHNEKTESLYDSMAVFIKNTAIDLTLSASVGAIYCIEMCGSFIMEQYQKGSIFITSMVTLATTPLKIWKCLQQKHTESCINPNLAPDPEQRNTSRIWKRLGRWLLNGMGLKKVKNGIKHMLKIAYTNPEGLSHTAKSYQKRKHAMFAKRSSYLKTLNASTPALNAAIRCVLINNERLNVMRTPKSEIAHIAAKHLSPSTSSRNFVVPNVSKITQTPQEHWPKKEVFNLMVEGYPMYYANGVLVHNCSLALSRFRAGGFIGTANDQSEEEYNGGFYRRRAAYY